MAGSAAFGAEPNSEVFSWLKSLPSAPEYHPTLAEFQDPISYIFKIEKEASKYGICKIVPPVPPSPKKTIITNLNRSLAARAASSDSKSQPTFTTRQQQIGFCPRKLRPVKRPVWQSGEYYTFQEFEAKAKAFEKSYLRKCTKKGGLSPLEIETLYWKATVDKPFSVEYANDMPGSAFVPVRDKRCREAGEGVSLGETAWNMRAVSRSNGSLLRFMKEEIPGVTSPMVYIAMMFSWFAWHVEDHDLHSLNYLHTGAGKTWYGVPSDAAFAFEEVVRVHGYGEEINPLVTFAVLGEKTTVMSPEVLIGAGVPCCRLVQNAGEFVVTFPRAYHTGFSHGLNCGEAANIATPEWLMFAKNAAIRRASVNYPPMVSHFQLLYDLALALCSRIPVAINDEPRSSRLKDKRKGEGDMVVKELFVQNVVQNNKLLHVLGKGSSVVILPRSSSGISVCSKLRFGSKLNTDHSSGLCSLTAGRNASKPFVSDDLKDETEQVSSFFSVKGKFVSICERNRNFSSSATDSVHISNYNTRNLDCKSETTQGDRISDQRLFSCVTCGVISFACVAILQPREPASRYLMSADCSFFNDWIVGSGVTGKKFGALNEDAFATEQNNVRGWMEKNVPNTLYNRPVQPIDKLCQIEDQSHNMTSNSETRRESSALGLLASAYGNSSDSEEDQGEPNALVDSIGQSCPSGSRSQHKISCAPSLRTCHDIPMRMHDRLSQLDDKGDICPKVAGNDNDYGYHRSNSMEKPDQILQLNDVTSVESDGSGEGLRNSRGRMSYFPPNHLCDMGKPALHNAVLLLDKKSTPYASPSDEDSSRMHVFCLEHAAEVEKQLRPIGGVHILLLCHPDFPKIEAEAKFVAGELGMQYLWNDISYKHATREDEERIQSALDGEEANLSNGDWAAKLGINLFYSAVLSRSPLYSKQMPYNSVIYNAFGRGTPASPPMDSKPYRRRAGKQKKVVAGNWCGKVWMSYQVHPLLGKNCEDNYDNDDISSHVWTSPDQKPERRSVSTQKVQTVRKYSRKRKPASENASDSIDQCIDREDHFSGISMEADSCDDATEDESELPLRRRILCGKQVKSETLRQMKQKSVPVKKQTSRPVKSGTQKLMKPKTSQKQPHQVRNNKVRNTEQFISSDEDEEEGGPSTRLRKRVPKVAKSESKLKEKQQNSRKKARTGSSVKGIDSFHQSDTNDGEADYQCDIEGCTMSFGSKQELLLHKKNVCPVKGCGKKFFSHKYLVQHRRVHLDDRPLRCPWKGCKMSFKWAWARTEHIRVHTGARPYVCGEPGCGQTFRFVSDFSRHKRKTGHSAKKIR